MDSYVKSIKEGLEESIEFFSNSQQGETEIWIASEFLRYFIDDLDTSTIQKSTQEPIDVTFNDIGFQIKEIQSEGRRRDKEYKDKLKEITDETQPSDFLEDYQSVHISLNEALAQLTSELKRHRTTKYFDATSDINVLVYLNLDGTTYNDAEVDFTLVEEELKYWKSVSVVTNNCAIVLGCSDNSQGWLQANIGQLKFNKLT